MYTTNRHNISTIAKDVTTTQIIKDVINSGGQEHPFYIFNIDDVIQKYRRWMEVMPTVTPYYAVKCNTHPNVLKVLAALGTGFDCATKCEINQVLSLGVSPSRIIYSHPTKVLSHITHAAAVNVDLMTFDSELELYKMKRLFPRARAVIRIRCDDVTATCVLGLKFGCTANEEAPYLLTVAKKIGVNVVGVSFHVGSGCGNRKVFREAIASSKRVLNFGKKLGFKFQILDIGGGFPGDMDDSIKNFADVINPALEEYFFDESIEIIAEPGTYFVDSAFTLACRVESIKEINDVDVATGVSFKKYMYYLNDGVFGSFNNAVSCDILYTPCQLNDRSKSEKYLSVLWGTTADLFDKIAENIYIPKLEYNEWVYFSKMGAYTITISSSYNGDDKPDVYTIIGNENCSVLQNELLFDVQNTEY